MRTITRLVGAFSTLADSLLSLASVVNATTDKLRLQLVSESETPALPHGEVIDAETPSAKRRKGS